VSVRARAIWVGVVAVLGILLAFPSFFTEQQRLDSDWISDRGINLGLDLQGGIHWLLRIDAETALRQELETYERDLTQVFDEREIPYESIRVTDDQKLELRGVPRADLEKVLEEVFTRLRIVELAEVAVLELNEEWTSYILERGVRQSLQVLIKRIDGTGVREPVIAPQGEGRILVQLPGEIDPKQARQIISKTTFLQFFEVLDVGKSEDLLRAKPEYAEGLPEDTKIVVEKGEDDVSVVRVYLVPTRPELTGAMLRDARMNFDRRRRPIVEFEWNNEGTQLFREFTGSHVGELMAIVIDTDVLSAPVIRDRIDRRGQIEGGFTQQEAADLAVALRSGSLPIPLKIEEERTVGPALGQDSIDQGLNSILIGGALVILFMIIYYRTAGVLANLALVLNIVLIIGLMSFAGATLTLPGIAGLVLTVGMAVDANVIIFERIREEIRSGKVLRTAVQEGFNRSRLTILDANITTLITAIILYYYGRGPVQGFGVTLAVGIFCSVFCALVVTRLLVELVMARSGEVLKI
jgi:preprotein translocase subunit SecD